MTDLPDFLRRDANNVAPYMQMVGRAVRNPDWTALHREVLDQFPKTLASLDDQSPFPWKPA